LLDPDGLDIGKAWLWYLPSTVHERVFELVTVVTKMSPSQ
jgi:hypothetical protein